MDITNPRRAASRVGSSHLASAPWQDPPSPEQRNRHAPGLSVEPNSSPCCRAKALMASATASSAGTCPALAPAPTSRALPMPATASGVAKAGFFRMSWSTVCLPISGSCPASDCSRMRLHWLPKRCGPHFPVVVARRGVAVPSPAKTNRTGRARRVTTRDDANVLHPRDTVHSRPPTPALSTLHVPSTARGAPWPPVMSAATTTTRASPSSRAGAAARSIRSNARSTHSHRAAHTAIALLSGMVLKQTTRSSAAHTAPVIQVYRV